jgi:hypothetical protein
MSALRYTLHLRDFRMSLETVELRKILLHEEIIPELLEKLADAIERDGFMKHPIIVDGDSLVILDGNHRTEALKKLGYRYIPVCMVDYQNPLIEVRCWYRTVEGGNYDNLVNSFKNFETVKLDWERKKETVNSTNALAIVTKERALISNPYKSLPEAYEALRMVETNLRNSGFRIGYASEETASKSVLEGSALAYVAMPPLTKKAIIEIAQSGRRFPCKTSRHIFPARPMGIDFPVRFLKGHPLDEANREFYLWVSRRYVDQIPSGSVFEGRRYDEIIFLLHQ